MSLIFYVEDPYFARLLRLCLFLSLLRISDVIIDVLIALVFLLTYEEFELYVSRIFKLFALLFVSPGFVVRIFI